MPNKMKAMAARFKRQHIQKRRTYAVVTALALAVTVGTVWALVQPAVAMAGKPICGLEEHTHTDECYQRKLICGQEESETHTHTDECWNKELICTLTEHTHVAECYESAETVAPTQDGTETQPTEMPDSTTAPTAEPTEPTAPTESAPTETVEPTPTETTETIPEETTETVPEDTTEATEPAEEDLTADQLPKEIPETYTDVRTAQLADGRTVSVYARPDTIPADVKLKVQLLDESGEEFSKAVEQLKLNEIQYDFVKAVDISLRNEQDEEVEPLAPVYVVLDAGSLLPLEAKRDGIQIQHHIELPHTLELLPELDEAEMVRTSNVKLETVLGQSRGMAAQEGENGSCVVTFPVDSFSVFTITSKGWNELNIRVDCVDEREDDLVIKGDNIVLEQNYTPNSTFTLIFSQKESQNHVSNLKGYQFDEKAYYMENGQYKMLIYGLRHEKGKWYYYEDHNKRQMEFQTQPDFLGKNPKNSIRLIYKKVSEIPVSYEDMDGNLLPKEDSPDGQNPATIQRKGHSLAVSDIDGWPKCNKYYYIGKAYVKERGNPHNDIVSVFEKDGKVYAFTAEDEEVELSRENPLKLVYAPILEQPETSTTVQTRDKGMKINIFQYNSGESFDEQAPINKGKSLQFVLDMYREQDYNRWTGPDGGIYMGLVEDRLQDGYPVLKVGNKESLRYLFDPQLCKSDLDTNKGNGLIREVHLNLDRLFYLDKDGYYRYDAMRNFATLRPDGETVDKFSEGRNFTVYTQPALPKEAASGDNPKFLPLNTWSEANRPTAEPAQNEKVKRYHFGMTMETPFVMPIDGKVPDGSGSHKALRDMIFEFNGDDDVWVFIDDKLVLDLGGIHDRYGGKINFRTGEVTTNSPPMQHSSPRQKNLYGIKGDPKRLSDEELSAYRNEAGFGRFSQHTIKFFYLERGRGASNCEIHFNLVPVAHGLVVGKRLTTDADLSASDHTGHQFQLEVEYPGGERKPLVGKNYTILQCSPEDDPLKGGTAVGAGSTDKNGRLWLHAGQRADFVGAIDLKNTGVDDSAKAKIFVSEVVLNHQHEHNVQTWSGKEEDGTCLVVTQPNGSSLKRVPPLYDSGDRKFHAPEKRKPTQKVQNGNETLHEITVDSGRHNEFNWIDFENDLGALASLNITKQAFRTAGNTPITGQSFNIKIELWDEIEKKWVPLDTGSPYWILGKDDEPPKPGQAPSHLAQGANGQIAIQHDQKIHLKLVPGTKYKVSEVLEGEDAEIYAVTYTGTIANSPEKLKIYLSDDQKQIGIGNEHEIQAGAVHNVIVTNQSQDVIAPKGSFALTKKVEGEVQQSEQTKFNFELRIKAYQPANGQPVECTATYYDTPAGITRDPEVLVFTVDQAGGDPKANVGLYPGETVAISGLPLGYSMAVYEKLTEEQAPIYDVTIRENKQSPVTGTGLDETIGKITENGVLRVTCINTSKLQKTTVLKITKQVKRTDQPNGAPTTADRNREFDFNITLKDPVGFADGAPGVDLPAEIQTAEGPKSVTLKFEKSGSDYVAKLVKLKHGETLTLPGLPTATNVVVQESNYKGYVVSMNQTPGDSVTVHLAANTGKPYDVLCVNMTGVELPETGGHGLLPYYLIAGMLMGAAAVLLYQRRKQHGETA